VAHGNHAEADDLIQQAFHAAMTAWAMVGQWGFVRQKAWLRSTIRFKGIDAWRVSNRVRLLPDLDPDHLHAWHDTAEEALCSIAVDRTLKVVFAMPPVPYRVMWLYGLEGMSVTEVAEYLGITPSTVSGHLKAARDTLNKEVRRILPFSKDDPSEDSLPRERW
jgi:RNA polymerase sigma factor (sigma-70 family)